MSCKILDKDWSFEVADDDFVHALKAYNCGNDDHLVSPW